MTVRGKTVKTGTLADKRTARLANTMKHVTDTKTEGVGRYVNAKGGTFSKAWSGKPVTGLTRRQTYKLENRALKNEALKINSKPEMIKAMGVAFAQNLAGPTTGLGLSAGSKMFEKGNNNSNNVNNLIGGGANQAGKDNEEEQQSLEEQYSIR